jgi:hypothetical protein
MDHRQGVRETPDRPLFPVAAVPGLPSLNAITTTPLGARVFGFTASGYDALDWWHRLREAHAATGYWPVLMGHRDPEYLANSYEYADPADSIALADTLDGTSILTARGENRLRIYRPELVATTLAELPRGRRLARSGAATRFPPTVRTSGRTAAGDRRAGACGGRLAGSGSLALRRVE